MKDHVREKVSWHVRAGIEWGTAVLELFPALWDTAKVFAPLVADFCPTCGKVFTVAWFPVGKHSDCGGGGK